jgi:hypothetical protein
MAAPLIAAAGRALMAKLLKSGLTRKESAGLVEEAMGSKVIQDALTKGAKSPSSGLVEEAMGSKVIQDALSKKMKCGGVVHKKYGGEVKKMETGGAVSGSRKTARKGIDGCAIKGKTRAVRNV